MWRKQIFFFLCIVCPLAAAQAEPGQMAPGQMDNFSLSGFCEKGKKNWDLTGKSADIDGPIIKLNDIQSTMYGDNSTVHLTARQGDFNRQAGQLHLEKDVVVTTSDGATLTTDRLDWDRKEQLVTTPSEVNIEKEDIRITGQGARGRTDLNTVDLEKDVRVRIEGTQLPGGGTKGNPITIRCDGPLQFDYAANTAVFNTNVNVVTLDCRIESDTLEAFFTRRSQPKAGGDGMTGSKIERIVAKGNVKITRNDNVSYCEEATYTALDRKISLTGSPRLVIFSTEDFNAPAGNKGSE